MRLRHRLAPVPRAARTISIAVTLALSVGFLHSTPDVHAQPQRLVHCAPIAYTNDVSPSPQGVKSWLIKQALELIATGIRKGGRVVQELMSFMDASAAKAFRKHARDIADALDDIARIPDLSRRVVKDKLRVFLTKTLELNHGTAQVIVTAVDGVLAILV